MALKVVLPNITMIQGNSNSYLIASDGHHILIDTGMDKNAKEILGAIESYGNALEHIFITHGHIDHTNGLYILKERYPDAIVASSQDDMDSIEGRSTILPKGIMGYLFKVLTLFMRHKGVNVDRILKDGETYENFKVIASPGHTAGSLCLLLETDGKTILFSGDSIINSKNGLSLSPKDFNQDERQMLDSLRKIYKTKIDILLPGHGDPVMENVNQKIEEFIFNSSSI
jgi:glyoxylase-like metal-dependent hydrolase (beta-lactamase superfamily II)